MDNKNLSTYLNDHYAGSVFAIELIGHLIDSAPTPGLKSFLENLRGEITADQSVLRDIMARAGIDEDHLKTTSAWISEKLGRIKLHPSHEADSNLLLSLESLLLGICGKKALWRALAGNRGETFLSGIDFVHLEERADEQIEAVDLQRLEAARASLYLAEAA